MAVITGNTVGNIAILDAFVAAVNINGWVGLGESSDGYKCLRAPGALAGHEFFLYVRTVTNVATSVYSIEIRGAAGFDATLPVAAQRLISPPVFVNLWQNAINYWFYISNRRAIIVTKCNTVYGSAYVGLLLPFAFPTEYPKPFCVAGNYQKADAYNIPNSAYRSIADPGVKSSYYLNASETGWIDIANHGDGNNADFNPLGQAELRAYTWPARTRSFDIYSPYGWSDIGFLNMRPTLDSGMPNFATHIVNAATGKFVGVMDGVYNSPGYNRASEQLLTEGGSNYRLFQNMHRVSGRNFMSIKEV